MLSGALSVDTALIHTAVNCASFPLTEIAGQLEITALWKVGSVKNDAKSSVACMREPLPRQTTAATLLAAREGEQNVPHRRQ